MALDELDFVALNRSDHPVRFIQSYRHWLFDDDMLAVLCGKNRMLGVKCVGSGNPDCIDLPAFTHLLYAGEGLGLVSSLKFLKRFLADVGPGRKLKSGDLFDLWQDLAGGCPQACDPQSKRLQPSPPLLTWGTIEPDPLVDDI